MEPSRGRLWSVRQTQLGSQPSKYSPVICRGKGVAKCQSNYEAYAVWHCQAGRNEKHKNISHI